MEVIEITIQIDPSTEEITVIPKEKDTATKKGLYIDWQGKPVLVDIEKAQTIVDSYRDNCASEMIGKTDFILVYDSSKTVMADGHQYVGGEALIMKLEYGLKSMSPGELETAMAEYRSRQVQLNFGPFGIMAYEVK